MEIILKVLYLLFIKMKIIIKKNLIKKSGIYGIILIDSPK